MFCVGNSCFAVFRLKLFAVVGSKKGHHSIVGLLENNLARCALRDGIAPPELLWETTKGGVVGVLSGWGVESL